MQAEAEHIQFPDGFGPDEDFAGKTEDEVYEIMDQADNRKYVPYTPGEPFILPNGKIVEPPLPLKYAWLAAIHDLYLVNATQILTPGKYRHSLMIQCQLCPWDDEQIGDMQVFLNSVEADLLANAPGQPAHWYAVPVALGVSAVLIAVFEVLVYGPWNWLRNHPSSLGIQIGIDVVILFFFLGLFNPKLRKYWPTILIPFAVLVASLIG